MNVASTLNKSLSGVQVHGQRFRALLDEAKGSCDKVEKLLEQARLTVCSQREQLARLSAPFD